MTSSPSRKRQPSSRTCFVCGRDNPVSLKMKWDQDCESGEIRAAVTLPDHFNGYPGVAHGGVIAAVLDETAGRSVLVDGGSEELIVTANGPRRRASCVVPTEP